MLFVLNCFLKISFLIIVNFYVITFLSTASVILYYIITGEIPDNAYSLTFILSGPAKAFDFDITYLLIEYYKNSFVYFCLVSLISMVIAIDKKDSGITRVNVICARLFSITIMSFLRKGGKSGRWDI
ncbi:hypothetical protein J8L98_01380 [Pseudoalteromonas sp. MMG013]|uniref:hypothetical protein n=1 Tax=Pseudoalteromonas sp. MMG013 TaxID=2822687 RepID=UPI001B3665E8|nr:hypothetical protein [Pseudoalteromonas sp. MMG013]MBQ4860341.1 hypothetical protein [Pseudoalteromonas sp. MMG013]